MTSVKTPPGPMERPDTVRRQIAAVLQHGPASARDISEQVGIPEHDVAGHLEHLRHSLQHQGDTLVILPAACKKCGFSFAKRQRLSKPGRCPVCRGESIRRPQYAIRPA